MANSKHISFRVSESEHQQVANSALAGGLSITDYARSLVLQAPPKAPSSTPRAVYAALDTRLSTVEAALQRATTYLREDNDASN